MHDGVETVKDAADDLHAHSSTHLHVHKRRKGIYILPNLFTLTALFSSFYAIVMTISGRFDLAAIGFSTPWFWTA